MIRFVRRAAKAGGERDNTRVSYWKKFPENAANTLKAVWKVTFIRIVIIILAAALFTAVFTLIVESDSPMYKTDYDKTPVQRFVSGFYYAIISMTTIGYGDYSPKTVTGKLFAIALGLFGIVSISLLTANIASLLVEKKLKEGRGLKDFSFMKNHFIVCGWKKNMETVLKDMLLENDKFKPGEAVIIANVDPDKAEIIRQQNPQLKDINFLRGDYYNEAMLRKANVQAARQVFILADESEDVSATEIDSKTVMAAMTIHTLSRDVRVCAELLDTKYEHYLKNAHVDEIIYTNDYGRLVLAGASGSPGLTNVINALLNMETDVCIQTHSFPPDFIGKTFAELRDYFREKMKANLIGLVENVGSYRHHKKEAIREAQKTPDISKLVERLQKVKTIVSNNPNLHPDDDYTVQKNSLAVVIERNR
ncbi:MAG: ion channel [bacterium]